MIVTEDFLPMLFDYFGGIGTDGMYEKTDVSYDPATGVTSEIAQSIPVRCIVLDPTLQSNGYALRNGTNIQTGDKQIFILPPKLTDSLSSNFTVDPAKDKIVVGSEQYNIVTFKQVNPQMGDSPMLYEFYCRV